MLSKIVWGRFIVCAAACCLVAKGQFVAAQAPAKPAKPVAAKTLDEALTNMAVEVEGYLKNQSPSIDTVTMGSFLPPPGGSANAKIVSLLKKKLEERVKVISGPSSWGITGKYAMGKDKNSQLFVIKISATLTDESGENGQELVQRLVTDIDEITPLSQTNAELPLTTATAAAPASASASAPVPAAAVAAATAALAAGPAAAGAITLAAARTEALVASIKQPDVVIAQNVVKPAPQSLFGVKLLLVGQGGKIEELVPVEKNGVPFVDIRLGQQYMIQLINNADFEAGAAVSIDGVNTLEFSSNPAYKAVGKWIVPPRGVGLVKGWLLDNSQSQAFQIMEYNRSAAKEVGAAENNVGVITVTFCAAFTDKPPPDEPVLVSKGGPLEFGTGRGPVFQQQIQEFPRRFGAARTTISIRYLNPTAIGDLPADAAPPAAQPQTPPAP